MTDLPAWNDMVLVGRVARAHGNRGQVIVNPETDFPESRFAPGRTVYSQREGRCVPLRVATLRFHRGRPIIGFDDVSSMDAAEAMAGAELRVPEDELSPLPDGMFWVHDLVGCEVETGSGERVGVVERVEGQAAAMQLVVGAGPGEILIPLAAEICRRIDVARKRIVVAPPDGLLDLNRREPKRERPGNPRGRQRGGRVRASGAARER